MKPAVASVPEAPFGWRLAFALMRALAQLSYAKQMRVAWLLAPLLARAVPKRRAIAAANIALCFPELSAREQSRLVEANLRSTAVGLFESSMAWFAPLAVTHGKTEVEGIEHLHTALRGGHGALCLFSHFTSIELGGRLLSEALERPMHQMVRRHNDPGVETVIDDGRRAFCEKTIEKHDLAELLRSLKDGHPVGYAPDQNFNRHMAFVPFFGQPAATLTTTSRIARMARTPVLCCWVIRNASGYGYRLRLDPPLANFPGRDAEQDTARIIALLESQVRQAPEQYLWTHRRFKTQPEGAAPAYEKALLKGGERRGPPTP
jgi:KDO2-lipid IV(A) lauroyltransferase